MEAKNRDLKNNQGLEKKLGVAGWSLFFIWMGIAVFAHVGWAAGLLGVGSIILGIQVTRKYFRLRFEGFWVVMGSFFILGGVWELFSVPVSLLPVLCIAGGFILLVSIVLGRPGDCIMPTFLEE